MAHAKAYRPGRKGREEDWIIGRAKFRRGVGKTAIDDELGQGETVVGYICEQCDRSPCDGIGYSGRAVWFVACDWGEWLTVPWVECGKDLSYWYDLSADLDQAECGQLHHFSDEELIIGYVDHVLCDGIWKSVYVLNPRLIWPRQPCYICGVDLANRLHSWLDESNLVCEACDDAIDALRAMLASVTYARLELKRGKPLPEWSNKHLGHHLSMLDYKGFLKKEPFLLERDPLRLIDKIKKLREMRATLNALIEQRQACRRRYAANELARTTVRLIKAELEIQVEFKQATGKFKKSVNLV